MGIATQEDIRFAHLLEPIRDLASNWDVNIADELEDYLVRAIEPSAMPKTRDYPQRTAESVFEWVCVLQEVLEAVKFSFEDGPSLNFAEGTYCTCSHIITSAVRNL